MKKIVTVFGLILFTIGYTFAQAPEQMSYQAIVRAASGTLATNQVVGMQISVLQGSVAGAAVYTETQTPTSNANGLVTLALGTGVSNDVFSAINWGAGPYFIKTETDLTGGTNYSLTSTQQLMSVPYALYAKTSGSSTTNTPELEAVLTENNSANNQQIKNLQDPTEAQDAATKTYVDVLETRLNDLEDRLEALENPGPSIGDFRDGGVVFYLASTPTDLDGDGDLDTGLICAIADGNEGETIAWYDDTTLFAIQDSTGTGVGTGAANTGLLIDYFADNGQSPGLYAVNSIPTGWFLPSRDELRAICLNRDVINATAIANGGDAIRSAANQAKYWTSSLHSFANAFTFSFFSNEFCSPGDWPFEGLFYVRAVKAF